MEHLVEVSNTSFSMEFIVFKQFLGFFSLTVIQKVVLINIGDIKPDFVLFTGFIFTAISLQIHSLILHHIDSVWFLKKLANFFLSRNKDLRTCSFNFSTEPTIAIVKI